MRRSYSVSHRRRALSFPPPPSFHIPLTQRTLTQIKNKQKITNGEKNASSRTEKTSSSRGFRMLLYSTGKDPSKEKWDGASTRFEDVVALFGADDARPLENFADDVRALAARAEHVYVDVPAAHHHHHHHRRHNRHRAHHRRAASSSSTTPTTASSLLKHYFSRGRGQTASSDDVLDASNAESELSSSASSYFDVVPAWKQRPLAPLVGELRCVKSAYEIEVMKASAEISARAHAKVGVVREQAGFFLFLFWLMRAREE